MKLTEGIIIIIAFFCYFFIPILRTFFRFIYWRRVRQFAVNACDREIAQYGDVKEKLVLFFGHLDGIEADNSFWLENDDLNVKVKGKFRSCFVLPSRVGQSGEEKDYLITLFRVKFNQVMRVISILSKPQVMVSGKIINSEGAPMIEPEIIVFYEGSKENIISRVLYSSSPKQALISFSNFLIYGFGSITIFLISFISYSIQPFEAPSVFAWEFALALMPIFFFIPPAVFFLYFFRKVEKGLRIDINTLWITKTKKIKKKVAKNLKLKCIYKTTLILFYLFSTYASSFLVLFIFIYFILRLV